MTIEDKAAVFEMMKVFYASPAVLSNGSDEIFSNDIENCINDSPYYRKPKLVFIIKFSYHLVLSPSFLKSIVLIFSIFSTPITPTAGVGLILIPSVSL